ncbi:MAG: electron transport complex subunit RsxC [Prevotellaceae bacterium]|jgi:electron transport complex protein RnfC|nr:electron transport complex subunit RsxC [Prevotellaceae bacterium]
MLKTFKLGGIHPADNKMAALMPIEDIAPEGKVQIFVSQHLGAPAEPIVAKGDTVKVGQLIAKSTGFVSANIHSSVSGTIASIDSIPDHLGIRRTAITITVEGDEWLKTIDRSKEIKHNITITPQEIIAKITEAGIVGLGGAAFPTHVKLSVPQGKKAETLLINGAECEPYLTSDYRVMMEYSEELLIGVLILKKALNVPKVYIGIEVNKQDAINKLKGLQSKHQGIEIVPLKMKYPQGGEKQLIKAIINREVPSGSLPIDVGAIVHNVGTAYAVYEAVQKNKPLIENILTITGKNVKEQKNLNVRVGTPLSSVLQKYGGLPKNTGKIILGGPMMGKAISNLDAPTQKSTSAILIMPQLEASRPKPSTCIRCSRCVSVCPMGLEPYLLIRLAERKMYDDLEKNLAHDCIECGCCIYSCPANLSLLDYIRLGKTEVLKIRRSRK